MDLLHAIFLALIQGFTEFLPISSSAHLILPSEVLGWPDQGLAFDVAVHVGTLSAVLIYFRHDLASLLRGWLGQVAGRGPSPDSHLAWMLILATVPAGIAGLLFHDYLEIYGRSVFVIATTTIIFGVVLGVADKMTSQQYRLHDVNWRFALFIGMAQAVALIPGTSRSGITITAALFLGFGREDAARFSFLMSIPIILLSGLFEGIGLATAERVDWLAMVVGVIVSGVSAYVCIHFFLRFIARLSMMPFVIYRLLLGTALFLFAAG